MKTDYNDRMNYARHLFPSRLKFFLTPHHELPSICKNICAMHLPDLEQKDKMMFPDRKYLVPVVQPTSQEEKMACRWREDRSRRRKKMNLFSMSRI